MQVIQNGELALQRLFAASIEHVFQTDLGIADPPLTDYLAELLCRFVRLDALHGIRDAEGRRLEEIAQMLIEAECRSAGPKREIYRHIGDFTLFWSGLYPEALSSRAARRRQDHLLDYCEQGKRSYYLASKFQEGRFAEEAPLLRRLSDEFELCGIGLNRVRQEWARLSENVQRENPPPSTN